jgi:hypothetical protein
VCQQLSLSSIELLQESAGAEMVLSELLHIGGQMWQNLSRSGAQASPSLFGLQYSPTGEQLQHCSSAPTLDFNCHDISTENGAYLAPPGSSTVGAAVRITHEHRKALSSSTSRTRHPVRQDTLAPWLAMALLTKGFIFGTVWHLHWSQRTRRVATRGKG